MLKLDLNALFTPELVAAFQKQWAAEPEAALAQADAAIRMLVAPRDDRERAIAELVVGLVGPEPDGLAWLEALAVGNFQLRDNVTYAIGRTGQSPARFIERQRDRIARLVGHPRARGKEADMTHAYNDALRLVVASALLTQMKTGVAAKAALGPAWPLMVAVDTHFGEAEKRALYQFGNEPALQEKIAGAAKTALAEYRDLNPDKEVPGSIDYERSAPPGADVRGYFERKADRPNFPVSAELKARGSIEIPDFIRNAMPGRVTQSCAMRLYRCQLLLINLEQAQTGHYAFSMAHRSERRRVLREAWLASSDGAPRPPHFDIETAIFDFVRVGGFFPGEIPVEFVHYLEEDACWFFNEEGENWRGLEEWRKHEYFRFKREPISVVSAVV